MEVDKDAGRLVSSYGRTYPVNGGVFDLRLLNNDLTEDQKIWKSGQRAYEMWSRNLAAHDQEHDYFSEIESVREVYQDISIEGRCLDVGGHQGRLRQFLAAGQEYITCDPFLSVFDDLDNQPNLLRAYPFLREPVNFLCCDAEFLPFRASSFQTVHMRSVIDHFLSPELALNEAYRVLSVDGVLVVGLLVHGGRRGYPTIKDATKEIVRESLGMIGINRFKDYHVWHPTFTELSKLVTDCGFKIDKVHWQKGYDNTVCYIRAVKQPALSRHTS